MLEHKPDSLPESSGPVFSRGPGSNPPPVSTEVFERTSKNCERILLHVENFGQCALAARIGVNESRISHWKEDGSFERTAKMLAIVGLKVVPIEARCEIVTVID